MTESFPPGLPAQFDQEGFSTVPMDLQIRTKMDAPFDKVRKKFTKSVKVVNGSLTMTLDQRLEFKDFYRLQCANRFYFPDPFTGAATEAIFLDKPKYQFVNDGLYCKITLTLGLF